MEYRGSSKRRALLLCVMVSGLLEFLLSEEVVGTHMQAMSTFGFSFFFYFIFWGQEKTSTNCAFVSLTVFLAQPRG